MVDLGREEKVHALIYLLLEVCRHHAVRVYLSPESRLPEEVIIPTARSRFPGIPVPHQVCCQSSLQMDRELHVLIHSEKGLHPTIHQFRHRYSATGKGFTDQTLPEHSHINHLATKVYSSIGEGGRMYRAVATPAPPMEGTDAARRQHLRQGAGKSVATRESAKAVPRGQPNAKTAPGSQGRCSRFAGDVTDPGEEWAPEWGAPPSSLTDPRSDNDNDPPTAKPRGRIAVRLWGRGGGVLR